MPTYIEKDRRLLLSWAKAGKDSEGRSTATRSEGDDLEDFDCGQRVFMIAGGLDSVTALRVNDQKRAAVYTKH